MRISDWSSDVCSSDLIPKWRGEDYGIARRWGEAPLFRMERGAVPLFGVPAFGVHVNGYVATADGPRLWVGRRAKHKMVAPGKLDHLVAGGQPYGLGLMENVRSEEHTSELQSLMRISYAVFCLQKKNNKRVHLHRK